MLPTNAKILVVHAGRSRRDSTDIERSRAAFVTPNAPLAKTTREFFQPDGPHGAVALATTDHALASVLWLKNPTSAPDLPTKRPIADAYAALQPSDAIWKLYLAEIGRLQEKGVTTADEYFVLRHAQVAKRTLIDLTQGDQKAFSAGTVDEVLAVAKDSLTIEFRLSLARKPTDGVLWSKGSRSYRRTKLVSRLVSLESPRASAEPWSGRHCSLLATS